MVYNRYDPGDRCCTDPCADSTYMPPFAAFPIAEGAASASGDRWLMASGDRLQPPAGDISAAAEAWFHTVHLKSGDCDIHWDGLTIQYRSGAGTISVDGHNSIVIPAGELAPGWAEENPVYGVYLTLYVTPEWYAVIVSVWRSAATSRGSIQVVSRDNTTAAKGAAFDAVGGASVASWRFADATATEQQGMVYRCASPILPSCTERTHQSIIAYEQHANITADCAVYFVRSHSEWPDYFCEYQETISIEYGLFDLAPDPAGSQCRWRLDAYHPQVSVLAGIEISSYASLPFPAPHDHYPQPGASLSMEFGASYCNDAYSEHIPYISDGTAPAQAYLGCQGRIEHIEAYVYGGVCGVTGPPGVPEDGVFVHRVMDSAEGEIWIE